MPSYEVWVNPSTGSNSNAGTQAAPFATLRHACYNAFIGLWAADVSLIVNVVAPSGLQADDRIRLWPQHLGASILVRPASGSSFVVGDNYDYFVEMNPSFAVTLRVENCTCTRNKIAYWQGTEATGRAMFITLADCDFVHARTNTEAAVWIRETPAGTGLFRFENCTVIGWDVPFNIPLGGIDDFQLDNTEVTSNGTTAPTGGTSIIAADDVLISGSTITMANHAVANRIDINAINSITINEGSVIDIKTTGSIATWIRTLTSGSATIEVDLRDSSFFATCGSGGWALFIGRDLNTSISRAANKALGNNLQSCLVQNCDIVQRGLDAGTLAVMVDADDAIVQNNYMRVGALGDTTNVHQNYLWADGIQWKNNLQQCGLLAFGNDQEIENNLIIGAHRCIFLGGTQGGSTTSGGGNNYRIRGNALISFDFECYSDYGYNGAYSTYIGDLVADVNLNQYTVLDTADGISRLTSGSGLLATTMAELRNVWANSVVSGSGSVWGDAGNASNDSRSVLIPLDRKAGAYAASLCVESAELTRAQLQSIRRRYVSARKSKFRRVCLFRP